MALNIGHSSSSDNMQDWKGIQGEAGELRTYSR
jgi:hypothetical protein